MKKIYENMEIEVILLVEDIVRTSGNDNATDLPELPEIFG